MPHSRFVEKRVQHNFFFQRQNLALSSGFSTDGSLISASAIPHCLCKEKGRSIGNHVASGFGREGSQELRQLLVSNEERR